MDTKSINEVLTTYEIEMFIEQLQLFDITEYGCPKWFKQNHVLQKLNIQAHLNAIMNTDQQIMESCVTFEKIKMLIYDLIMSEMWKKNVLPIIKGQIALKSTFRPYMAIQHEAVICNLLELIFFHRTAVEAADNYLLEIIDYCYRNLSDLIQKPPKVPKKKDVQDYLSTTAEQELDEQVDKIKFSIQMMCLAIIRYISDHVKYLPLYIVHNLIVENDFFFVLIPLIESKPWMREIDGRREIYENSKWITVEKKNYSKLPMVEAQVWICIYNLLMNPECRKKYEINDFRKNNLLRLRKYLNELLLDQIPGLTDMLRTLEELSIMNVASYINTNSFIVQQLPELRMSICKNKDWKAIAETQILYFNVKDDQYKDDVKQMAELYGNGLFEGLLEGFNCNNCQQNATKRCSKCKQVWYCSRDCQLSDWKVHKPTCQNLGTKVDEKMKDPIKPEIIIQEVVKIEEVTNLDLEEMD